jgi:hypothetical protein
MVIWCECPNTWERYDMLKLPPSSQDFPGCLSIDIFFLFKLGFQRMRCARMCHPFPNSLFIHVSLMKKGWLSISDYRKKERPFSLMIIRELPNGVMRRKSEHLISLTAYSNSAWKERHPPKLREDVFWWWSWCFLFLKITLTLILTTRKGRKRENVCLFV